MLAAFEREGGVISNESQRDVFVRLVRAMRCDPIAADSELKAILFGKAT